MSGLQSGGSDDSFDADDLSEIRERFKELTKEKEMLRDSKSEGFDLIKRLEFHVKTLSASRGEDKKRIMDLERELSNCVQEIDYLQEQLGARNLGRDYRHEQECNNCQLRLSDMKNLDKEVRKLNEQIKISKIENSLLIQELDNKNEEIRCSASQIRNLEESISNMSLEYQCEIESIKLDTENSMVNELFEGVGIQNRDAYEVIALRRENEELKEKLRISDLSIAAFANDFEEHFSTDFHPLSKLKKDMSIYGDVLGPLFSKLANSRATDVDLRSKIADMSRRIDDYELLTRQLKEQLKEERAKAKEEAEDLAQEMAELRYQLTLLLDEERKRRASIENLYLQRITELEAQIAEEQKKSTSPQDVVLWKK